MNRLLKLSASSIKYFANPRLSHASRPKFTGLFSNPSHFAHRFSTSSNSNGNNPTSEAPFDLQGAEDVYNRALDLLKAKNLEESKTLLKKFLEMTDLANGMETLKMKALLNKGLIHFNLKEYDESLLHCQKGFQIGGDLISELPSPLLNIVAQIFFAKGDYDNALTALLKAHEKFDSNGKVTFSDVKRYVNLGNIYYCHKKDPEEALKWLNEGMKLVPQLDGKIIFETEIISLYNMASKIYENDKKDWETAQKPLLLLIEWLEKYNPSYSEDTEMDLQLNHIGHLYIKIGALNLQLQKFEDAYAFLQKGYDRLVDPKEQATYTVFAQGPYFGLAEMNEDHKPELAYEYLKQVLRFINGKFIINQNVVSDAHQQLAILAYKRGMVDETTEHLLTAIKEITENKSVTFYAPKWREKVPILVPNIGEENLKKVMDAVDMAEKERKENLK